MILKTTVMDSEAVGSIHISSVSRGQGMEKTFESDKNHTMLLTLLNPLDHMLELSLHWDARHDLMDRLLGTPHVRILSVQSLTFSYISHTNET